MTPDEIIEAYNVLSQNVQDNTAREAARIGNAQRSLGTLAERVASPSGQTSGLANYTYDRTMRPVVDSTSKALVTQGLAQGLQSNLTDALRAAKNRYEDARNRAVASGGGGGGGTTGGNGNNTSEVTDPSFNMTFDFNEMVDSVRRDWGIYGRVAFKEDIQAKLYEEYQAGKFDASEYLRLWTFADNEYPSINDPAYNNGLGGSTNDNGSEPWVKVPGTDSYVDRDGNLVLPGSRVGA